MANSLIDDPISSRLNCTTEAYKFGKSWTLGKYETMITYNGKWLDYQERCDTLKQAKIQHQEALLWVMLK